MKLSQIYEIEKQKSEENRDEIVLVKDLDFKNLDSTYIKEEPYKLSDFAKSQISSRLGIPHRYLKKCPAELQCINMSYWKETLKAKELLIRKTPNNVIRAFLTQKYVPMDNYLVLQHLLKFIPEDTNVDYRDNGNFMQLNIVKSDTKVEIRKGDFAGIGFSITNSEVGIASLAIASYILRYWCANGATMRVVNFSNSYKHTSTKVLEELPHRLEETSNKLKEIPYKLTKSLEYKVDNLEEHVEKVTYRYGLGGTRKEAIEWAKPKEVPLDGEKPAMFHVINTFTRAAQYKELKLLESYQLQKVGGKLLDSIK